MKNKLLSSLCTIFALVLMSAGLFENPGVRYTPEQIVQFIREVYADQSESLIFQNDIRLKRVENFLCRVAISKNPEFSGKKFALLSGLRLIDKYNPDLKRDVVFDPLTFNPLKYRFPMASKQRMVYRVDHTDFLIIIDPIP